MLDEELIYQYQCQHENTAIWKLINWLHFTDVAEEQVAICRLFQTSRFQDNLSAKDNLSDMDGAYSAVKLLCETTCGDVQAEAFRTLVNLKIALQDAKAELADEEALRWFWI